MKKIMIFILLLIASISYGQASLSGTGTWIDPYQIWDYQDLDTIRYYPFGNALVFRLMADIDMDSSITGKTWEPIGYGADNAWDKIDNPNKRLIMHIVESNKVKKG